MDIDVVRGDITALDVDAVVNAANVTLAHGGGVAAAIAGAAGPGFQEESDAWVAEHGPLRPGAAAVTGAGALPARWVVHVAGPIHAVGQDNEGLLRTAVRAALDAAAGAGARSVALPAISAGIYGYPAAEATAVIASEVMRWGGDLDRVLLVGFSNELAEGFRAGVAAVQDER